MQHLRVEIVESAIDHGPLTEEVSSPQSGAVVLFLGITRNHHEGRRVKGLEYHCYREMALSELERVAREVAKAHGVSHFVVIHRVGRVDIGEASLAVAAGSAHRKAALEATHDFINRLKQDVPIWEREYFEDASVGWVEGADIKPSQPA